MMKRILFLLFLIVSVGVSAQPLKSKAYKTGNYIFCGTEIPRHFSYLVEKKGGNATEWTPVAELRSPKNEAECEAALLRLPGVMASLTTIDETQTKKNMATDPKSSCS